MKHCLIYENEKGECRIVVPDEKFQQPGESDESSIARLYDRAIPEVAEFIAVLPSRIPTDLTFREAWKKGDINEPIKIDFHMALEIHRKRLQETCERKIAQLNLDLEKALERDNLPECVAIRRTKKILRTLHEMNLTHCKTIQDIKKSVPKELHDVWTYYPLY